MIDIKKPTKSAARCAVSDIIAILPARIPPISYSTTNTVDTAEATYRDLRAFIASSISSFFLSETDLGASSL
jgi:hypothetical protein